MTHKEKFTRDEMGIARKYFERAIEISPESAEPYGWLAWTYFFDAYMGWSSDPQESLKKAFEAGQKCVDLDPELDYGHWVLGSTNLAAGQVDRSLAEYNRALELNPNNSDVLVSATMDRRKDVYSLAFLIEFPTQSNRENFRRNREMIRRNREFSFGISETLHGSPAAVERTRHPS
jgi:tetratricopeptide (TPR) repeat protein